MNARGFGDISERYDAPNDLQLEYNNWLIEKSGLAEAGYTKLGRVLIEKPFYYFIENDVNRYVDGINLRRTFSLETLYDDYSSLNKECNCLEMIYALANRINMIIYDPDNPEDRTEECFFAMLQNLDLLIFDDEHFEGRGGFSKVNYILEVLLERSYDFYGNDGLFPNPNTRKDQRNVEIWYQMSEYINENWM